MRVVVQRCKKAEVSVTGETVGSIGPGLVLLVGIAHGDTEENAAYLAEKIAGLRIFEDPEGKMNLSLGDIGGSILSVSQFTLYGDCRKGKRPSFIDAARPELAMPLYDSFNRMLEAKGITVATGKFGADMDVELTNWGPVTLILEHPFES